MNRTISKLQKIMKTKLTLLFFGLLFSLPQTQGADHYQPGDTLYVWAGSGLNVRATPGLSGKKIGQLQAGDWVKVLSRTTQPFTVEAVAPPPQTDREEWEEERDSIAGFDLRGHWVEMVSEKFRGYVVDMYLLRLVPPPPEIISFHAYFEWLEKATIPLDTTWYQNCEGGPTIDCYYYVGRSAAGIELAGSFSMLAIDETIAIPDMTIEEGFVFYHYFRSLEDAARQKKGLKLLVLLENEPDHLSFSEEELCDISISVEGQKLYISQGCSC